MRKLNVSDLRRVHVRLEQSFRVIRKISSLGGKESHIPERGRCTRDLKRVQDMGCFRGGGYDKGLQKTIATVFFRLRHEKSQTRRTKLLTPKNNSKSLGKL